MDQELQMIEYLLNDVKQEIQNHKDYKKALEQMHVDYERVRLDPTYDKNYDDPLFYLKWYKPYPKKANIKQNLRMIRRLTLKIEKEVQEDL